MGKLDLTKASDETLRALEALTYMDLLISNEKSVTSAENYLEVKRELYRRSMAPRVNAFAEKEGV